MPEKAERTALVRPSAMRGIEIGAVLLSTVAVSIAYNFFPHPTFQYSISQMTWELPRDIGMSALLIILLADNRWESLRGKVWAGPWSHQIALAVMLVASVEVLRNMLGVVLTVAGVPSASPSGNSFASPAAFALYPAAALESALYEESLYRAYLLARLAPWAGDTAAVILSAVCFAAVHGYPPRETGILFTVGVLYGAAYVKMRSLPALVAVHWIHNLIWWARQAYP
jgi:membrane protease YdiL (CAAX protease family)